MTPTQEIARREDAGITSEAARFMPVMSMAVALDRREIIVQAMSKLLHEGIDADYGIIPGTKKKTLLQPGAQKLDNLFGLVPRFIVEEKDLDWNGARHNGESFFYFEVRCQLWRGEFLMGEGLGSANSWEGKYRYRNSERVCPECGKESIIKGKADYGGGWLCFKKKGGCGAKFADGDSVIEGQEIGKKPNPDIADVVNTVMKIASKRSHVAATINATSASEFFTQDVEDQQGYGQQPAEEIHQPRPASGPAPADDRHAPSPENERVDQNLVRWLASLNGPKEICEQFEKAKKALTDLTGNDITYYTILDKFNMRHANAFKTIQNARACGTMLYREILALKAKQAEVRPPAPDPDHGDAYEQEPQEVA